MKQVIIHHNNEEFCFLAYNSQEVLKILFQELAPERLWAKGWKREDCWSEVREWA